MAKDSFILYLEQKQIFEMLTDEEAGQLIKAIFEYEDTRSEERRVGKMFWIETKKNMKK